MYANLDKHQVWRNNHTLDLSSKRPAWNALAVLARNYPTHILAKSDMLWRNADTELGSVYAALTVLRDLLKQIGITIPKHDRRGYVLAET